MRQELVAVVRHYSAQGLAAAARGCFEGDLAVGHRVEDRHGVVDLELVAADHMATAEVVVARIALAVAGSDMGWVQRYAVAA